MQRQDLGPFEFQPTPATQACWQCDGAETNANQPAHGEPDRIEQTPNLAVAPLRDHYPIPAIGSRPADFLDNGKSRGAILEFNPSQQLPASILLDPAKDTNGVLALPAVARMHEPIGDIARSREDQQTFRVQIQTPHGNPAGAARLGKALKDQGTLFRIVAGHHLARGLVI